MRAAAPGWKLEVGGHGDVEQAPMKRGTWESLREFPALKEGGRERERLRCCGMIATFFYFSDFFRLFS
jgi:hypothetical protein